MSLYLSPPGVVCCAGTNRVHAFEAACAGDQRGIQPFTLPGNIRVMTGSIREDLPEPACAVYAQNSRFFRIADAALEQIRHDVEQALAVYGPDRIGVCIGSCDNGSEASVRAHSVYFSSGAFPSDYELRFQEAGLAAEYVGRKFGLSGPALTIATACASSAGAIIKGAEFIRSGLCDAVIVGGADIASETVLRGFGSLEAISSSICNPFSKHRNGITLGEGAAFFVMSSDATETGIELLGSGESADAFHMTAPRADGSGAIRAMKDALAKADISPESVDYLNLHGTGTPLNDRMEALAIAAVFSDHAKTLPVSSTKPITGHTLGAAGALELAFCWMVLHTAALGKGALPLHCWDGVYDEELPRLCFVQKAHQTENPRICMSNSFAFGGCNVSLILGKKGRKEW